MLSSLEAAGPRRARMNHRLKWIGHRVSRGGVGWASGQLDHSCSPVGSCLLVVLRQLSKGVGGCALILICGLAVYF